MQHSYDMQLDWSPSVFILNLSYTGLGIARSFAELGIKICGIGSRQWVSGNFSRYIEFHHSPDSLNDSQNLCDFLITLAKKERARPVIFPTRDHDIIFLNDYREELERYLIIPQPVSDVLDTVLNKWKLFQAAETCNILSPTTYLVNDKDQLKVLSSVIEYPILMKPVYASDWRRSRIWKAVGKRKTIFVRSEDDLWATYKKFYHLQPAMLLQQYIEGDDDDIYTFCSCCNRDSDALVWFNTHKILQIPERFGTGIVVQSAINDDIVEFSKRLLKHIGYMGISEIEYKRSPYTGNYYLIEINPRLWDQHQLSRSRGINLPLIAYNFFANGITSALRHTEFRETTWIAEDGLIQYLLSKILAEKEIPRDLFRKIRGKRQYAIWDPRDPLPFIVSMGSTIMEISKKTIRKLFQSY